MNATPDRPWTRLRIRVPREDQSLLALPPLSEGRSIADRNREFLEEANISLQGRPLPHLRQWTRRAALRAAREYTATWAGDVPSEESLEAIERVFVSGHQPLLYHPGVWAKNFALAALARRSGGVALNLVVDNDTLASTAIRVPAGSRDAPRITMIPFDDPRPVQPWEDARILNRDVLTEFPARVAEAMRAWGVNPVVTEFWPMAVEQAGRSDRLADCLTAARNQLERSWGLHNLELPLSRLCRLEPFLWFASHLLAHLPRFRDVYNRVLEEYRVVNKVRSRKHPVADLREQEGWHEAPFWVWRAGDQRRAPLFARQADREVLLSDGNETLGRLRLAPDMDACCAVEGLRALEESGIHLRTRALTTTLFSRLCLGDLFVHGIGGAKYDEMTDRIITRFFRVPAPGFLTISATLRLPLQPHSTSPSNAIRLRRVLRDLDLNPERFVGPEAAPQAAELVAELRRLVEETAAARENPASAEDRRPSRVARHARHVRLRDIKRALAAYVAEHRRQVQAELDAVERQLEANEVLQDRDFSFCLYPAEKLRGFLTQVG